MHEMSALEGTSLTSLQIRLEVRGSFKNCYFVRKQEGGRAIVEPHEQHSPTYVVVDLSDDLRSFSEAHPAARVPNRQSQLTTLLKCRCHVNFPNHNPCQQKPLAGPHWTCWSGELGSSTSAPKTPFVLSGLPFGDHR